MAQQFGMQMPAARKRGSSLNVYTGLAAAAMLALAVACAVAFNAASRVGKGGSPFSFQEKGKIELKSR
ncbi:MAG TPA: hypothetical protein VD971_10490 [Phycisphaerales bacterium]|nr:hypothetical protein [Phycisphaerales bacterium]